MYDVIHYHLEIEYEDSFYLVDVEYYDKLHYDSEDWKIVEVNQNLDKDMDLLIDFLINHDQFEHYDH